jgi:hypothetical protein
MSETIINRIVDIQRFYELLSALEDKLQGKRKLSNCHGRMDWPMRGVYFFYERGEIRTTSGVGPRVVRIGTHALKRGGKATLWNRLRHHKGVQKDGGGNHRGSVFRLHVGTALINRDDWKDPIASTWGDGSNAPKEIRQAEKSLEQSVSQHIGNMPFLWLEVADAPGPESDRGVIEHNTISLLSNYCSNQNLQKLIDPASERWLGKFAKSTDINQSGLWNVNHVRECYDPNFLDLLESYVHSM